MCEGGGTLGDKGNPRHSLNALKGNALLISYHIIYIKTCLCRRVEQKAWTGVLFMFEEKKIRGGRKIAVTFKKRDLLFVHGAAEAQYVKKGVRAA